MRRLYYVLFILLVFTSTISPSMERVAVAEDAEFYVYEIRNKGKGVHDETPVVYRYVMKLKRLSDDVFELELLSAEPESFEEHVEGVFKALSFQLKLMGPYNISIDNAIIHFYYFSQQGILPFLDAQLFLEPELVKIACEKASKVDEAASKLIDAWKRGLQEDFRRLMMLFYEPRGEYAAIGLVTNFLFYILPDSIRVGAKDLKFKLTSTCSDHASVLRIAYSMVREDREESRNIEVVYSSTGWLIYARYESTITYLPLKMTSFHLTEIKLIETSSERLLKDMQMFSRGASAQSQVEGLTSPLVIGLIVVLVSITGSVLFLLRKR